MSFDDTTIMSKYCSGTKSEQSEVLQLLQNRLIPKAVAFMYKHSGKGWEDMMKEIAWNSFVGKSKLLDRLCSSNIGSIEAYYLTIVRRDWVQALEKAKQIKEPGEEKAVADTSARMELVDLLSEVKLLKGSYQAPILISAMGYSYTDIQEDYESIKNAMLDMLKSYGVKPREFQLDGDIRNISHDVFRQRISQGRQRLKALYYRN